MFKKRTAFIVGAGASAEVGLPVGIELAEIISNLLGVKRSDEFSTVFNDRELLHQCQRTDRAGAQEYVKAFRLISQGVSLSNSIDDFLDVHRQNKYVNRVGKAAIVKSILEAERNSKIHVDGTNIYNTLDMGSARKTWLIRFVRMLGRGVPLEEIENLFKNISFIVFNYDRCIEHFLYHAVQQLYAVPAERASEIVSNLNIIHPYGDVGQLKAVGVRGGVEFGGDSHDPATNDVVRLSERIRTYTEVKDDEPKENIDIAMQDAESWVFIGFGYHAAFIPT